MRYLSTAEIIELHRRVVAQSGGALGLRDAGALESSVTQPFQTHGGEDLYPSFITKIAAQAYFLIRNHPFVDGNKRVGHAVLEVTLALNQLQLAAHVDEQESLFLATAAGSVSRDDFTSWVNNHLERLSDQDTRNALEAIRDFPQIRARMTRARASHIRGLRVDRSNSWRVIASECFDAWGGDASWEPPSNVLAGMELCEAAAPHFGEHFEAPPWNIQRERH